MRELAEALLNPAISLLPETSNVPLPLIATDEDSIVPLPNRSVPLSMVVVPV